MALFDIKKPEIEGLIVASPKKEGKERDYLFPDSNLDILAEIGVDDSILVYSSETYPRGLIRGLYFDREDEYGRLLSVKSGGILAIAVDMRPESITFGGSFSVELNEENESMLYIPPYFAYGFMTLEQRTEVIYNTTDEYDTENDSVIIWDDEILAINWQYERYDIDHKRLNMTKRDKKAPSFRSYNIQSLWPNRVDAPKKARRMIRLDE